MLYTTYQNNHLSPFNSPQQTMSDQEKKDEQSPNELLLAIAKMLKQNTEMIAQNTKLINQIIKSFKEESDSDYGDMLDRGVESLDGINDGLQKICEKMTCFRDYDPEKMTYFRDYNSY